MKKLAAAAIACSLCGWAADFWQSKPFTDWSDKDVQKMVENSPWSKPVSIALPGTDLRTEQKMGGVGRGSMGEANAGGAIGSSEDPMAGPGGGGSGGGHGRNRGGDDGGGRGPIPSITVVIRWQTALPVKQALVKMKYGAEASTSEEAKKALENQPAAYVIAVSGVGRGMVRGDGDTIKKELIERTSLSVKGNEIKPADVQFARAAKGFELYFVFPKRVEFSIDDKEIEFATKFESVAIKQKFRLKDMVYNGKLAL